MRRRDRTGGKVKARRHKALTLKRRNTLKAVRRRISSPAGRETSVARLSRELSEAFEQQAATAEILNVISNSPTDTQPVFDAIVQCGLKLFPGALISVALRYGDTINAAAVAAPDPARVKAWRRTISRTPLARDYMHGAALLDRRIVDIPDVADAPAEFIAGGQNFLTSGNRAITIIPMMRGDEAIGLLSVVRLVAGPLSEKQLAVLKTFADQAVIAIENTRLLNELRERTDDLSESLEQQTATSEILAVISNSLSDTQPVFEAIVQSGLRLFADAAVFVALPDGDKVRAAALAEPDPARAEAWRRRFPFPLTREYMHAIAILDARVVDVPDVANAPADIAIGAKNFLESGYRAITIMPMMRGNVAIGALSVVRLAPGPLSPEQLAVLKTFADQAVIAVENTRLLNELRARTEELRQLNEQLEKRVLDQVSEIDRMGRLRRFLPPQVADLIVSSGAEKQLESHRREITALFCDLRGFTGFSESADPEDVMALLREYHAAIGEIIFKHGGTLERFVGDGVMVIFNDPLPLENPSLHAVQMALEMRTAIGALVETWRRMGHELGFGIGISHGFATLGTIGFEGRFDYAAIGTVSNVASRLCDEAKPGQILISSRVLMAVEDAVTVEPAGELTLKGIRRPMSVHNVVKVVGPR
jgi:class 3 adenylate cyclase